MNTDEYWMQRALALAEEAKAKGEVPIGAVIVKNDLEIASGYNQPIAQHDPSAHAEIMALRAAGAQLQNYRLIDTTLYVTLEPCLMCVGAITHARVKRLVFGAADPKSGACGSVFAVLNQGLLNHSLEVIGGVLADSCGNILRDFFKSRRDPKNA